VLHFKFELAQFYINLLMELHQQNPSQGYNKQAFNISEKSLARTLLELLSEAKIDLKEDIDPKLSSQEQILYQQLDQAEKQRLIIYQDNNNTDAQKAEINQTLDQLTQQFQQLQEEIRHSSPKYAAFKYPQPTTTEQIQNKILDNDTVLLQYTLGKEKSYLWVVTKDSFNSYELPNNTELTELINNVRRQITDIKKERFPDLIKQKAEQERIAAIQQISQIILQPAAPLLNKKRILIIPDGALYTLPFSVLSTSDANYEPLATHHEIINLPSSSTLDILRQNSQNNSAKIPDNLSLAIFADPVFTAHDCRLNNSPDCNQERLFAARNRAAQQFNYVDWQDLPGTYTEAENIIDLFPNKTNIKSAFGFAATRDQIIGNQLENYDLIHFATHGFFDEEKPDQSGLVFSLIDEKGQPQNGFLRLDSIFNMKLNASLVVMSACQTGLGEEIKGEGMVGLSRGFMYAGASDLLMSLWSVDDAATAEFMTRFYRLLLQDKLTPAAALTETQRQMREKTEWSHPYYWSAFILQGDWY
jgi:CHAT domain-containing protein